MNHFILRLAIGLLTFIIGLASAALAGNIYSGLWGTNTSYDSRSKVVQPARVETKATPQRGRSCFPRKETTPDPYAPPARNAR